VLELARLVDDADLAEKLEAAYTRNTRVLALTIPQRETILAALEDPPAGLEEAPRRAAARARMAQGRGLT
jgi:hypothetical protein